MDKVISLRIPHVGELIFESVNTSGLIKCLEVSQTWKVLAENVLIKRWKGKMFQACNRGHIEIVKLLLKHSDNIDLNAKNNHGQTAFIGGCRYGRGKVVQFLLADPCIEVNTQDDKGRTAIIWACLNGNKDVVQLLLDNSDRIELNARDGNGCTAFMKACFHGEKEVVQLLMEHSKYINTNVPENHPFTKKIKDFVEKHSK